MVPGMVQACSEQSQERQRDQLDLKGAQDGLLDPGAAFFHWIISYVENAFYQRIQLKNGRLLWVLY
jgi:hypothetical protein